MSPTTSPKLVLPYGRQTIDEDDVAAVAQVLRSDCLTTGPEVQAFETAFAERVDAPFAVACSSGTAALHLAALALDIGLGDRVIIPTMTFVATANAVRLAGAEVHFADVDPSTGLMGPAELENALTRAGGKRPKAVFSVHLNGQCVGPEQLSEIAEREGLCVVEDACHALGTRYDAADGERHPVGAARHADLTTFSFHPVKTIAAGEGGMVTARDSALAARLRRLRNHGIEREPHAFIQCDLAYAADGRPNPWYYEMPEVGLNYRSSDIACALGRSQLAKLDSFAARRKALVAAYDQAIARLVPLVRPVGRVAGCEPAWHLYVVHIDFETANRNRAEVMHGLAERGIGSQVHYLPVHRQPFYRDRYGALSMPGAEAYYTRCLSLPLFPAMTEEDVDRVVRALGEALGG